MQRPLAVVGSLLAVGVFAVLATSALPDGSSLPAQTAPATDIGIKHFGPKKTVWKKDTKYTIAFLNYGTNNASQATATVALPANALFAPYKSSDPNGTSAPECTVNSAGTVVTCVASQINSFSTKKLQVVYQIKGSSCTQQTIQHLATLTPPTSDANSTNNTFTFSNTLHCNTTTAKPQCKNSNVDDDGDGKKDYPSDTGCTSDLDDMELNDQKQCNDGIDNDGDGKVDFGDDPGCANNTADNTESDGTADVCGDGLDNDNDGKIDYPDDKGCSGNGFDFDETNPPPACRDGIDNDGDGEIDTQDKGCGNGSEDEFEEEGNPDCYNGFDDDNDGALDSGSGKDAGCSGATDTDEANPKTQCQDGLDNDSDGKIDLNDPGCDTNQDTNETGVGQCADGLDNDWDGVIDFPNDTGCARVGDNSEVNSTACFDTVDNDGDGAVDWPADFSCADINGTSESTLKPQCGDGADNDGDGKKDYPTDTGCTTNQDDAEDAKVPFHTLKSVKATNTSVIVDYTKVPATICAHLVTESSFKSVSNKNFCGLRGTLTFPRSDFNAYFEEAIQKGYKLILCSGSGLSDCSTPVSITVQ